MTDLRLLLREMLRVSMDASGRERSPDEQHADLVRDADSEGFDLHGQPYREVGSASRFAKKERKDFATLISDLKDGSFGADGLALWESSRGSRKVGEWIVLVELLAEQGKRVWVHTHERLYDPRKARDRKTLLEDAISSEYEVGLSSERLRRAMRELAEAGEPSGRIPFGYRREYRVERGKRILVGQVPHETEAPLIAELFRMVLEGRSMKSIAVNWAARGIVNGKGVPFGQSHLRRMAENPTYAGWRIHAQGHPEQGRRWLIDGARWTDATWPPLVERKDFLEVQRIIADRATEVTWQPGRARHLLSMIVRCDVCSGPLVVGSRTTPSGERYRCGRGHVSILKGKLDKWVLEYIFAYLSRPDVYRVLRRGDETSSEELSKIEEDLARLRLELRDAEEVQPANLHEARAIGKLTDGLSDQISRLEVRREEHRVPSILRGLVVEGADVRERWEAIDDISAYRNILRELLSPRWLGELRVMPSVKPRTAVPTEDRIVFLSD